MLLQLKTAIVDLTWLRVDRNGEIHALTETEGALLRYLVAQAGRDVDRDELQTALGRGATSPRAIDIAVARLRAKLGESDEPFHIRTVRGVGYRFVDGSESQAVVEAPAVRGPVPIATGRIDLDRRLFVDPSGEAHALGKLDVDLLERLVGGAAVDRDQLMREVWGRGQHERSLSSALRRLRLRLGDDPVEPRILLSLPGSALRLVRSDADKSTRTNLRAQRTPFVPRPEVDRLLAMWTDGSPRASLVTVRGPAGIGKTRLVYEAGLRLLDRDPLVEVWFCDLTCALAEQGILRAVETALGIGQGPSADPAVRIGRVLARKPVGTVLILDNFDQVTQHTQALEAAMRQAPNVRFVTTSRHALGLPAEQTVDVGPLDVDGAANLFVDRAMQGPTPRGDLDPRSPAVRTLVERLDCLPLALELAAARAAEFTVDELVSRLGDRLNWLVRPPAETVSPHRSLRGALDWSWDLLDERARAALARCAVFPRAFSARLAADVLEESDVDAVLEHLAARSLLDRTEDGAWRQYEGIRDYAREKLILQRAYDATLLRHAVATVALAERAVERFRGATLLEAIDELRDLRDDLLIIPTRPVPADLRARAVIALVPLLQIEGPRALIPSLCGDALAGELAPDHVWRLRLALGERARQAGRWPEADEHLAAALAAAEQVGPLARAQALRERAFAWVDAGRGDDAEPALREVLAVFRDAHDEVEAADVERYLAKRLAPADLRAAARELEAVRSVFLRLGDPLRLYHLHRDLAGVHLALGELDAAEARVRATLGWARDLDLRRGEYDGSWWLAQIARQRGDLETADRLMMEARAGYQSVGEDERARLMTRLRALVWAEGGLYDAAEAALSQAYQETPESDTVYRSIDLANLAVVWHLQDRRDAAIQAFRRLLEQVAGPMRAGVALHLAAALADDDRPDEAAAVLGSVTDPGPPSLREIVDHLVALARARVGEADPADAAADARGALGRLRAPAPEGGPSPARRDQDLHLATRMLEQAVRRTV